MVAVPAETPDKIPPVVMVAMLLPPSAQVPPVVVDDSVVAAPVQTLRVPVMAPGSGFTATVPVMRQPVASV